jgi:hypothetical protein
MVLNLKSLGIGCAIGVGIALLVVFAFLQAGQGSYQDGTPYQDFCKRIECIYFWLPGRVKDISGGTIFITQTFNQTGVKEDAVVRLQGGDALWCAGSTSLGSSRCRNIPYDRIPIGAFVCAHTWMYPDGSLHGGKVFFNRDCVLREPLDSDGDGLHNGCEVWAKTDSSNPNSDGIGLNDGDEDYDKDGLTNREECDLGTHPLEADTDEDGLNDKDDPEPLAR